MENKECCIPGHENQQMVIFTHRHWASFLKTIVIISFCLILPLVILLMVHIFKPGSFNGPALNFVFIAVSVYYMVITTFAFTEWITFYYDILAVTESEVIEIIQNGIFDRKIYEISILRVQDVSAEINGFWPTLFGYGDVVVESAGENSQKYVIKSIPRPVEIANQILKIHSDQVIREERHNEVSIGEGDFRKSGYALRLNKPNNEGNLSEEKKDENYSGDINKDDLDKGGEIKF